VATRRDGGFPFAGNHDAAVLRRLRVPCERDASGLRTKDGLPRVLEHPWEALIPEPEAQLYEKDWALQPVM
jgi:hypothetical protein